MTKVRVLACITALFAALASLLGSTTYASAAEAQNAYLYSHWNFAGSSTGYWNVDQQMKIDKKPGSTYWAQDWTWKGANFGGYLGLQTNGDRGNGTTGDTAIFSLWNATAASGPHCGTFDGEGNGYSCRLPYTLSTGTFYRYRVWRSTADASGQSWVAYIQNINTGVDTYLGSIRVPKQYTLITGVQNFVEYFGTAVACNKVPVSQVEWTQPAANSHGNGAYQYGSTYTATASDRGACTGGSATPTTIGSTKGVRVILGG